MILDKTRSRRALTRHILLTSLLAVSVGSAALAMLQPTAVAKATSSLRLRFASVAFGDLPNSSECWLPNGARVQVVEEAEEGKSILRRWGTGDPTGNIPPVRDMAVPVGRQTLPQTLTVALNYAPQTQPGTSG